MKYYVHIKHQLILLPPTCKCIARGKTRIGENGKTEAQFLCIDANCPASEIWATREQLIK